MKFRSRILSTAAFGLLIGVAPIGRLAAAQTPVVPAQHAVPAIGAAGEIRLAQADTTLFGTKNEKKKAKKKEEQGKPAARQEKPRRAEPRSAAQGRNNGQNHGGGLQPPARRNERVDRQNERQKTFGKPEQPQAPSRAVQGRPPAQERRAQKHEKPTNEKLFRKPGQGNAPANAAEGRKPPQENQAQQPPKPKAKPEEKVFRKPDRSNPPANAAQGIKPAPDNRAQTPPKPETKPGENVLRKQERRNAPANAAEGRKPAQENQAQQPPKREEKGGNKLFGQPAQGNAPAATVRNPPSGKGPQLPTSLQRRAGQAPNGKEGKTKGGQERAFRRLPKGAPDSDAAAQVGINIGRIRPITDDRGERMTTPPRRFERPEAPRGAQVVRRLRDRTLIRIDNRIIVQDTGDQRLRRHARDVYYETLDDGRVRVSVIRPDGSRVITIRNRYGDVVRRSRIMPDGREIVLIYVPDEYRSRRDIWYEPDDLPPMPRIAISDYVLTARPDYGPDYYYDFLERPPVVPIRRIYTLDQVRYTPRLREVLPRVDLEVHFATGSAEIDPSQYGMLENLADAIREVLDRNPAETFLIEGFTDAVGDPQSNLVLSDERAESVAEALTQQFGIPPENLVTQGYGESELKVQTQGPSAQNRRVAIQRITPLVTPVAEQ